MLGGDQNCTHTHTHTHTDTHTHTHTHTQTHRQTESYFISFVFLRKCRNKTNKTERGGFVVTHETRIREVPGSNPAADQPDWRFSWFSSVIKLKAGLDLHYHDSFNHYSSNS